MPYASERSKRRRCEGAGGTTPLERQVGMQIGSCLFAYDFGYKIIFLWRYECVIKCRIDFDHGDVFCGVI